VFPPFYVVAIRKIRTKVAAAALLAAKRSARDHQPTVTMVCARLNSSSKGAVLSLGSAFVPHDDVARFSERQRRAKSRGATTDDEEVGA